MTTTAVLATVDCRVCQKPWTPTREQPRLTHPDCAPDPRSELLAEITHAIRNHPRSLQRRIGPSEIGHPCLRRVAYTLGGYPEVNGGDVNWKATIGTAVHAWLADVFDQADWALRTAIGATVPAGGDDGVRRFASLDETAPPRWLVEEKVNTGTLNGDDIDGSTDLFDTWTGTAIDWKITGPRRLSAYRRTYANSRTLREIALDPHGQQYACQAQDYARGWAAEGYEVRNVGVFFLPRDGKLHEGHLWLGEYNPAIPEWFYQRAEPVAQLMQTLPREQHHPVLDALPTADAFCTMCPFYKHGSVDLTLGCPGDPNMGQWREAARMPSNEDLLGM